jgi:CRISPR-associated endonuclease/helicase Cas3
LRRKDLLDLWDTTPDLAGNDLDVSRFIRNADDTDVQFYWRDFPDTQPPGLFPAPQRAELCAVSVWRAREFLGKLKKRSQTPLVWKPLDKMWFGVDPNEVRAGMVVLLRPEMGGYLDAIGWTGDPADRPTPCPPPESETSEVGMDEDPDTKSIRWVALEDHLQIVACAAAAMPTALGEVNTSIPWPALVTAARWHDVGKSHPAFINMLLMGRDDAEACRATLWAKSDDSRVGRPQYWVDGPRGRESRVGFRHELASALAWLKHHGTDANADLIAFLIAAHHGKVRASIRSLPNENRPAEENCRFARGIWDGDELPQVDLGHSHIVPTTQLDLGLMELGEGESGASWLARVLALRHEYGPFRLSYLETLLRVADWRGSKAGERIQ